MFECENGDFKDYGVVGELRYIEEIVYDVFVVEVMWIRFVFGCDNE